MSSATSRRRALFGAAALVPIAAIAAPQVEPDAAVAALAAQAQTAFTAHMAAVSAIAPMVPASPGYAAAEVAEERTRVAYYDALAALVAAPAASLRGIAAKAALFCRTYGIHGDALSPEEADLAAGIADDLVRLAAGGVA